MTNSERRTKHNDVEFNYIQILKCSIDFVFLFSLFFTEAIRIGNQASDRSEQHCNDA